MFQIYNGRKAFWQWDSGQRLLVLDERCQQVHFQKENDTKALVCPITEEDGQRFVRVPDALLQSPQRLYAYALVEEDSGFRVLDYRFFDVYPRAKPEDYIYEGQERWTAEKAVEEAVTKAMESHMGELVKTTDYASNKQAGVVRIFNTHGLQIDTTFGMEHPVGLLSTKMATNEEITGKEHKYSVIVPSNLDYAVKSGLANSRIAWTDAEQKRACAQIGSIMVKENSDGTITATLPSGKSKTIDLSMIEIFL